MTDFAIHRREGTQPFFECPSNLVSIQIAKNFLVVAPVRVAQQPRVKKNKNNLEKEKQKNREQKKKTQTS